MKTFILVLVTLFAMTSATSSLVNRFLVTPKTITSTVTNTVVATATKNATASCAVLSAGITACRRRRSVLEEPIYMYPSDDAMADWEPSEPVQVQATAYPDMRSLGSGYYSGSAVIASASAAAAAALEPMQVESSLENTAGLAEVQISDLEGICKSRAANPFFGVGLAQMFGITVLYSTTVTASVTSTVTVTSTPVTNRFTIAGCTPSPFPFTVCP